MYASVAELQIQPVNTKEMIRIYRNSVVPAASQQPGFEGAFLLTDHGAGIGISIIMWRTEEDRAAGEASEFHQEQISKFSALFTGTPVRKHYEVSVRV